MERTELIGGERTARNAAGEASSLNGRVRQFRFVAPKGAGVLEDR